jgi:2'-5' RNA ligase
MSACEEGAKSALVVLVPEAETLVKPFRDKYDPGAAEGMPAHITLLYPFCPPKKLNESHLDSLRACFATFAAFQFCLTKTGRFPPRVLYLAPEPGSAFKVLTKAVSDRFPEFPPYCGRYKDPPPHLTVADVDDERELENIARVFFLASQEKLPIRATASQVALMDNASGQWKVRTEFSLGPAA